jgi:DNA (cytosine-5)-methyltransferase 1
MTLYTFFSGGGMAELGFGPGWSCAFANDVSSTKAASYYANFRRGHFLCRDVADLTVANLPSGRADCAWLSPPCIGHSEAGNKQGFEERESRAFWPTWSLIEQLDALGRAPLTTAFENVSGIKPENLAAVEAAIRGARYRIATRIVDARLWVPQSRERYFVIGAHADLGVDPEPLFAKAMRALPKRTIELADVIDIDPLRERSKLWEFSAAEVGRHLDMIADKGVHALICQAEARDPPFIGPFARRMRGAKSGERVQRVEVRTDGLANALRVASKGGSSRQFIIISCGVTQMRAIQPREAAKLMGLSSTYILPHKPIDALELCGDGVVVPVVRFLLERVIEPMLARRRAAETIARGAVPAI